MQFCAEGVFKYDHSTLKLQGFLPIDYTLILPFWNTTLFFSRKCARNVTVSDYFLSGVCLYMFHQLLKLIPVNVREVSWKSNTRSTRMNGSSPCEPTESHLVKTLPFSQSAFFALALSALFKLTLSALFTLALSALFALALSTLFWLLSAFFKAVNAAADGGGVPSKDGREGGDCCGVERRLRKGMSMGSGSGIENFRLSANAPILTGWSLIEDFKSELKKKIKWVTRL